MAYQGSGYFGGIRFNDPATAAAYQKGEGYYTTMPGIDPNQPGWGNLVPAGYELVGYKAPKVSGTFRSTNRAPIPGTSFAILKKQGSPQSAPAPAPAPAPNPAVQQLAELTAQSQTYRKEAEKKLTAADLRIKELEDEDLQAQKARDLQQRMQIVSAANQAMSQRQANLQIAPATKLPTIGGTQQFKRRTMNKKPSSNTLVSNALNI